MSSTLRVSPAFVALILAVGFATIGDSVTAQSNPLETYTAALEVDLVTLDVVVTDKSGQPVSGLEEKDFRLLEDGKKVPISRFSAALEGGTTAAPQIVVLVDERHLGIERRNQALAELGEALPKRMEANGTSVMVATYDGGLDIARPFTTDAEAVRTTLAGLHERPAAAADVFEARRTRASFLETSVAQLRQGLSNRREGQAAFDSMFNQLKGYGREIQEDSLQTLTALSSLVATLGGVNGKKALFFVSEGLPAQPLGKLLADFALRDGGKNAALQDTVDIGAFDSRETTGVTSSSRIESLGRASQDFDTFNLEDDIAGLAGLASSTRVVFYPVLVPEGKGVEGRREEEEREFSDLREGPELLAEGTGGESLQHGTEIGDFVDRALGTFDASYSLGFEPHGETGAYHALEVEVKGKGLRARHRTGYVRRSFGQRFADQAVAALMLDHGDNHHRLELEVEEQARRDDGEYDVKILVLFPIEEIGLVESEGVHWAEARVVAIAAEPGGSLSAPQLVQVPLQIPAADLTTAQEQNFGGYINLTLPAGSHRVALGLWDVVANRVSFLIEPVEIGGAESGS
jgi:VWFA-related protein